MREVGIKTFSFYECVRPDMKMLEDPEYVLCEIHEFGERRLGTEEKPLLGGLIAFKEC